MVHESPGDISDRYNLRHVFGARLRVISGEYFRAQNHRCLFRESNIFPTKSTKPTQGFGHPYHIQSTKLAPRSRLPNYLSRRRPLSSHRPRLYLHFSLPKALPRFSPPRSRTVIRRIRIQRLGQSQPEMGLLLPPPKHGPDLASIETLRNPM